MYDFSDSDHITPQIIRDQLAETQSSVMAQFGQLCEDIDDDDSTTESMEQRIRLVRAGTQLVEAIAGRRTVMISSSTPPTTPDAAGASDGAVCPA